MNSKLPNHLKGVTIKYNNGDTLVTCYNCENVPDPKEAAKYWLYKIFYEERPDCKEISKVATAVCIDGQVYSVNRDLEKQL